MNVGQMIVGQMIVGQMNVGQVIVGQMIVGQMIVGQMIVGQMNCRSNELSVKWTVGQMNVGVMIVGLMIVGLLNATRLKFISCRGAEKKGGHTHRQILSIIYIDCAKVSYIKTIGGVAFSLIILVIKNLYLLDCEK